MPIYQVSRCGSGFTVLVDGVPTTQYTTRGAATTLMGVLKAIDENFDLRAVHKVGHKVGLTIGA